ncbi:MULTISPECIES: SapB/AmfS family lanthipeptide [Streptomycetaceae]|uniref:AmfS protein n=1 Tax=Streptantibioticus cattleyicolor (strain ATCC 35852 / DSM 46488 / JCM 4925 / NBRC 14057 / NRRL 8057) TaxID=1003195 RepID=F8K375_STREN|nr:MULTISPECIES: SapB/AmfS family lanthipeptide [Streptomycetaceae]AEW93788.1 AmfS protein [Streptantibioticus cattleyicolor NRRL 8057 = DSM 46488]MYS58474.1 SapB/AmfS family lantipeptide [Streptomyces sp. SID5468]CCB74134.1 putative AmfS protein [Streptantibioticus cattleyicolor NRRL 8057 = DSM 46488]
MALLDLQNMESEELNGGGASTVSLLSCVSAGSVILCV